MLNFRRRNQPSTAPQHEYDTEIEVDINDDENNEQDNRVDSPARLLKAVQERLVSAVASCAVLLLSRRRRSRSSSSTSGCTRTIQSPHPQHQHYPKRRSIIRTTIAVLIILLLIIIAGPSNTTPRTNILRPLTKDLQQLQFFHFLCRSITWYIQQNTNDNNHNNDSDTASTALWRGTVPNKQIYRTSNNNNNNNNINIDVVISHYYCGDNNEDDDTVLQWIFGDWSQPLLFRKVFLFLKCEHARTADEELAAIATLVQRYDGILPTQTKIIHLNPNVGRCDHTYAHYLANYYFYNEHSNQNNHQNNQNQNNSTPADVTRFAAEYILFVKDNNNSHREHYSRHKSLREMIAISAEWGFACHEETNWIWSPATAHSETNSNSKATSSSSSSFITEISYYHDWERLQQYTVHDSYTRLARDATTDFHNPTQYPNLGKYAQHMKIQIPTESSSIADNNNTNSNSYNFSARTTHRRLVPVCYGGNFLFHSGGSGSASRTASAEGTTTTNSMMTEESKTNVPRYHHWYYHSQQFWKRIEVSLSRSNNIIEGHYMERLWGAILARPLSVETTNKLLHYQGQSHTSRQRHRYREEEEGDCLADTNHWGALCK